MKTTLIAELGSCHDGKLIRFHDLLVAAEQAGCTHAKAQFWSSVDRMVERRHAEKYREAYARYQMPEHWLDYLNLECRYSGIVPACSVYLPEDVATVAPYVDVLKVASFEALDRELTRACVETGKRVIVSTGMLSVRDVNIWLDELVTLQTNVELLHCVTAYPASLASLNLSVLHGEGDRYLTGFSDHSRHELAGAIAVAAGAKILEVHIRLDSTDPQNPDYGTALAPDELRRYVANVRLAEEMLGEPFKRAQPCEAEMMQYRVTP